jgi:hypothetical protein
MRRDALYPGCADVVDADRPSALPRVQGAAFVPPLVPAPIFYVVKRVTLRTPIAAPLRMGVVHRGYAARCALHLSEGE